MATYKVIQDIEAEDKLLGPLTMRQFIYAIIVFVSALIAFRLGMTAWWLAIPFVPHTVLFALLAMPFGHDQSSELWLLAKIQFMLKPHRRIWNQSGIRDLVRITAPKKTEKNYTDNLTQSEVKSRLSTLAATIDSRGWAIKNVNLNLATSPSYLLDPSSDRLVNPLLNSPQVPDTDVTNMDDILDANSNPTAHNLEELVKNSADHRRQNLVDMMHGLAAKEASSEPAPENNLWFAKEQPPSSPPPLPIAAVDTLSEAEKALLEKAKKRKKDEPNPLYSHLKVIQPLSEDAPQSAKPAEETPSAASIVLPPKPPAKELPPKEAPIAMTSPDSSAIIESISNNEISVEQKTAEPPEEVTTDELDKEEVVINLH